MELAAEALHARIDCVDPATREPLGSVRVDSPVDVDATVARARLAQKAWGKTSFAERRRVLSAILAYTVEHKEEICEEVQRASGKTRENALVGEVWPACEKLRWMIGNGEKHLRPEKVSSGLLLHKRARLEFHPLGVVAAIIPWNYPFQNLIEPDRRGAHGRQRDRAQAVGVGRVVERAAHLGAAPGREGRGPRSEPHPGRARLR